MAGKGYMPEGHSINRPPYFDGTNFTYWKNRMQVFLRAQDHEIWKVVNTGPHVLSEDESKWTEDEVKKAKLNYSAMNIMQCAINPDEYSRVSNCSSAMEMWNKLKLIYEGTSEVKETKANMLITEYELFRMKNDETISEMFARLSGITNGLKSLGKAYTDTELVRKVLRSLTPIWHTKATVIEDSKNLATLTIEELIGSLMTYEMNLKKPETEVKKSKSVALKASSHHCVSTDEEESDVNDDEKELAMLTRKMRTFLRRRKNFQSNGNIRRSSNRNFTDRGESSRDKPKEKEVICYECKKPGHMRGECPDIQKKARKFKTKKAMKATWSDSEEESCSDDSKKSESNLCLMADHEESTEVNDDSNPFTLDQWEEAYSALLDKFKRTRSENKGLKQKIESLVHSDVSCMSCISLTSELEQLKEMREVMLSKIKLYEEEFACHSVEIAPIARADELEKEKHELLHVVENLKKENSALRVECEKYKVSTSRLLRGKSTLDEILSTPVSFQREGLGYMPKKKKTIGNNGHVKSKPFDFCFSPSEIRANKRKPQQKQKKMVVVKKSMYTHNTHAHPSNSKIVCFHCGSLGHVNAICPAKKKSNIGKFIWIPKCLLASCSNSPGPKKFWVPKPNA